MLNGAETSPHRVADASHDYGVKNVIKKHGFMLEIVNILNLYVFTSRTILLYLKESNLKLVICSRLHQSEQARQNMSFFAWIWTWGNSSALHLQKVSIFELRCMTYSPTTVRSIVPYFDVHTRVSQTHGIHLKKF